MFSTENTENSGDGVCLQSSAAEAGLGLSISFTLQRAALRENSKEHKTNKDKYHGFTVYYEIYTIYLFHTSTAFQKYPEPAGSVGQTKTEQPWVRGVGILSQTNLG